MCTLSLSASFRLLPLDVVALLITRAGRERDGAGDVVSGVVGNVGNCTGIYRIAFQTVSLATQRRTRQMTLWESGGIVSILCAEYKDGDQDAAVMTSLWRCGHTRKLRGVVTGYLARDGAAKVVKTTAMKQKYEYSNEIWRSLLRLRTFNRTCLQ